MYANYGGLQESTHGNCAARQTWKW